VWYQLSANLSQTEAMWRGRPTAMLFIILMIIGTTLPAAARGPSLTPGPTPTGDVPANGTHPLEPTTGTTPASVSPTDGAPPLVSADETTALDMLGLAIPAHLRQAYCRARELLRDALIHHAPHPRPKSRPVSGEWSPAGMLACAGSPRRGDRGVCGFQPPRLWERFVGIDLGVFPRVSVG
jgi:hypothetical protein